MGGPAGRTMTNENDYTHVYVHTYIHRMAFWPVCDGDRRVNGTCDLYIISCTRKDIARQVKGETGGNFERRVW